MGFRRKLAIGMVSVLLWGSGVRAENVERAHITVLVLDSVRLSPSLLRRAEAEASLVFRAAGIEVDWVNCSKPGETDTCHRVPGPKEFVLHIVATGKTESDLVFGEAFLGEDGSGKYSDVFFDRLQGTSGVPELDLVELLGAVSAHELGHLLLGSRSHSRVGIMEPVWERESLQKIGMGTLLFTPEQSLLMRKRIGRDRVSLSAMKVTNRGTFEQWY